MTSRHTSSKRIEKKMRNVKLNNVSQRSCAALPSATKEGSALRKYSPIDAQRQYAHVRKADPAKTSQDARTE